MLHLRIDTQHNRVSVDAPLPAPGPFQFTRRWEAAVLAALLEQGRHSGSLVAEALQARLCALGQPKPLNRAQLQRLLDGLDVFLAGLPGGAARIASPPRKRTVGPWRLAWPNDWTWEVDGRNDATDWKHVALLKENNTDALHALLSTLMVADALTVDGRYGVAIQTLEAFHPSDLSTEGRCLLFFRLGSWHRHMGNFAQARACAQSVLAQPASPDPALAAHARFFLQRIDYDENPAQHWEALWQSTGEAPAHQAEQVWDGRTLSEWHNLRALLARRQMQRLGLQADVPEEPLKMFHSLALRHFQAALYLALWRRDWTTLQAYVANLAFHLQFCLSLPTPVGVTHDQVLAWHRLTMAYEDKLSAGRDSAWEYIYFAEFWLAHHADFQPGAMPDPLSHHLGGSGPDQQDFYEQALKRLRECGDDRQVAIGHSLYLQFASTHLEGEEREATLQAQYRQLSDLLATQPTPQLRKALIAEGYAKHWPAALNAGPSRPRKPGRP